MIWLTWRQFRAQAVTAFAALAAFAALLAVTGPHLASLYAAGGISRCQGSGCRGLANSFLIQLDADRTYSALYLLGIVIILIAPGLIGIFWGAPLVARELEAGTHNLAWNQSITRTRWLAVKLTLTGVAAMAVTEALSLVQSWWAAPIGLAVGSGGSAGRGSLISMGQFSPLVFATHGITPLAYAAFAFALGVTAGVHIRHAVPAMAITLAVFAGIQLAMPLWIRPHLFPPDHAILALGSVSDIGFQESIRPAGAGQSRGTFTFSAGGLSSQPGAWVLSSEAVDAAGSPVSTLPAACTQADTGHPDCLASNGVRVAVTYQPASRYWTFEWTETAIYLAFALALAGYCLWLLGRRLT